MTAKGKGLEDGGTEKKGKRTHGRGQQCGDWGQAVYKGTKWQSKKIQKINKIMEPFYFLNNPRAIPFQA